jgi:hypothetical protein
MPRDAGLKQCIPACIRETRKVKQISAPCPSSLQSNHDSPQHNLGMCQHTLSTQQHPRSSSEDQTDVPIQIDFHQPNGSTITNTISEGPKGAAEGDLLMTYTFEWYHPEIDAKDTAKVAEQREAHMKTAVMAVEKSIESIRRMVVEGKIKA